MLSSKMFNHFSATDHFTHKTHASALDSNLCLSGHTIDQVEDAKLKMNVFDLRSKTAFLHMQNKSF